MGASSIVFRADASVTMGIGHVMRCLTLADALQHRGAVCHFICRELAGHLLEYIRQRGHIAHALPKVENDDDWRVDAAGTLTIVSEFRPAWVIVDHYQLGQEWEEQMRPAAGRLLAIDDLGRLHSCDLMLDQNFPNVIHRRYDECRARGAEVLLGPEFALIRPEFAELRSRTLRRRKGELHRILVTMGGTDPGDETSKVLNGLQDCINPRWAVDVVVGAENPNRSSVAATCSRLSAARLHVQTTKMAELMAAADCGICAGGSTTWERCCLGLPALVTVLSPDQTAIADSLASVGAHIQMGWDTATTAADYARGVEALTEKNLKDMSMAAAAICDGLGAKRLTDILWL